MESLIAGAKTMGFKFGRVIGGLLVLLGIGQILLAQENDKSAIIAIRVTDVSGAAVEGAEVRFVEQARRDYEDKRTDKTGQALAELKPGKYEVTVTASRFKSVVIRYVEAAAAEHREFGVSLEVLPPVPVIVDPIEPLIEPEHIEPRDTEIRERFQLQTISDGMLCTPQHLNCRDRDIWWKNFRLLASDGHRLDLVSIPFPTAKRARKEFHKQVTGAQKILRREPESNSNGDVVGERALGWIAGTGDAQSPRAAYYSIFWTWDKYYWALTGEHLEDVLTVERRLKDEGTNAVWRWH
jgi:hypothetical protein